MPLAIGLSDGRTEGFFRGLESSRVGRAESRFKSGVEREAIATCWLSQGAWAEAGSSRVESSRVESSRVESSRVGSSRGRPSQESAQGLRSLEGLY